MKELKLTRDKIALVDDEDYEYLKKYNWYAFSTKGAWYARRSIDNKRLHRIIMSTPEGMVVDHIDFNGLNCQKHNMRNCSNRQNMQHSKPLGKYKGVSLNKKSGKYYSQIKTEKKQIWLGSFNSEEDAAKAYNKAAIKYFGEYAVLNRITGVQNET